MLEVDQKQFFPKDMLLMLISGKAKLIKGYN